MSGLSAPPTSPVVLTALPQEGLLRGSNGRYERVLGDMNRVYQDTAAFEDLLSRAG